MKNVFYFIVKKSVKIFYNKAMCLSIAFCMLFNLSAPAFAGFNFNQEEENLFAELAEELEAKRKKPEEEDPTEKAIKACLEKNDKKQCSDYIKQITNIFLDTDSESKDGKKEKEEKPISRRKYNAELDKNTKEEYNKNIEEIETLFEKEKRSIEARYKDIPFNSPENRYIFETKDLDKWKQENLETLDFWKEEVLNNKEKYYQQYLKDFEKSKKDYEEEVERTQNEFLQEIADNLMAIYDKSTDTNSKYEMIDLLVMLLSMETDKVKFFDNQQRSNIYHLFTKALSYKPCKCHEVQNFSFEQQQEISETQAKRENEINQMVGYDTTRQQYHATSSYKAMKEYVTGFHSEIENQQACNYAIAAVQGLAFFPNYNMGSIIAFMIEHIEEPTASEILLLGTNTLIKTNATDLLYGFFISINEKTLDNAPEEGLSWKESLFFDAKYYRTPYQYSRYPTGESELGKDVWQDMAEMLSKYKKDEYIKKIIYGLIDEATRSMRVVVLPTRYLPFIYGVLLYFPEAADNFRPYLSLTNYVCKDEKSHSVNYDGEDLFIENDEGRVEILSANTKLRCINTKAAQSASEPDKNKSMTAGELLADIKKGYKKSKSTTSKDLAKAYYNAAFADLTKEEKLAMDKALEKKYPSIKESNHKKNVQKPYIRLAYLNLTENVVDVALSIWAVFDVIRLIKWGVRGVATIRTLIKAGEISSRLTATQKTRFFRYLIKKHPNVVKVNRKLRNIKTIGLRTANRYPAYSAGLPLMRMSHDGQRALYVTKLGAKPAAAPTFVGRNTIKGNLVKVFEKSSATGAVVVINKNTWWNRLWKKAGKNKEYGKIEFNKDGFLEIDGELFKTFKATMNPEDIVKYQRLIDATIADLEKTLAANKGRLEYFAKASEDGISLSARELTELENLQNKQKYLELLKNRRYVTLRPGTTSKIQNYLYGNKMTYEILPIYDAEGNLVFSASLNVSFGSSKAVADAVKAGQKLVLKDGKIFLGEEVLDATIGVSKESITTLAKAGRKTRDFNFLTLSETKSKMAPLIYNNALTFSAAVTSLNMSLSQAPFNNKNDPNYISQALNLGLSVAIPYALSFLSPMFAPFVKRFGVRRMQSASLGIAAGGVFYASLNGYRGQAIFAKDENGNTIYDENGKAVKTDKAPSYWPLIVSSFAAGVSSALTRASLNIAFDLYKTSKATMSLSMVAKNVGGLSMVIIPAVAESYYGKNNVDFSISYPWLGGLALIGIGLMRRIPTKVAVESGYRIALRNGGNGYMKEMLRPFGLFFSKKALPYYLSFLSFGATESYVLFKTYNTFSRDTTNSLFPENSKNANKLIAGFIGTVPSALVRLFIKRKTGFADGIVHNVLFTTAGTLLLTLPSENLSNKENIALGLAGGALTGIGTANMYQYLQNRMLSSVSKDVSLIRKYAGSSALRTTAQAFYSGANVGLALPVGYSFIAEAQKVESSSMDQLSADFKANQKVLPIAFGVYGLGTIPLLRFTPAGKAMFASKIITFPYGYFGAKGLMNTDYGKYDSSSVNSHPQVSVFNTVKKPELELTPNLQMPQMDVKLMQVPLFPKYEVKNKPFEN